MNTCFRCFIWTCLVFVFTVQCSLSIDPIAPRRSAVYYGWPSTVNSCNGDIIRANGEFENYEFLLFGQGLEKTSHNDHASTKSIISLRNQNQKKTYLAVSMLQSISLIKTVIDDIVLTDATGVLFQSAEYDGGGIVTRIHQNSVIDYAHSKNISVAITASNINDLIGNDVVAANPTGDVIHLGDGDFVCMLGYYVAQSVYQSPNDWVSTSFALYNFTAATNASVVVYATVSGAEPAFSQSKFDMMWYASLLFGFYGVGWAQDEYFSANSAKLTLRTTEYWDVNIGTRYTSGVLRDGDLLKRHTTSGWLTLDTVKNTAEFTWTVCISDCSFRGVCYDEGTIQARCDCINDWEGKYCQTYRPIPIIPGWVAITLASVHIGAIGLVFVTGFGLRYFRQRKIKLISVPSTPSDRDHDIVQSSSSTKPLHKTASSVSNESNHSRKQKLRIPEPSIIRTFPPSQSDSDQCVVETNSLIEELERDLSSESSRNRGHRRQVSLSDHPMFWTLKARSAEKRNSDADIPSNTTTQDRIPEENFQALLNGKRPHEAQRSKQKNRRSRERKRHSVTRRFNVDEQ